MLGGHIPELLITLVLALVFFGPRRLPEIGSALGKGIRDFRRGIADLESHAAIQEPQPVPIPVQIEPRRREHGAE